MPPSLHSVHLSEHLQQTTLPFLKWPGGKRWFVQAHADRFPASFNRYIEPFLGSGAVFFHLVPALSILSDANPELINAYLILREEWERLELVLERHEQRHCAEHYYAVRSSAPKGLIERAARFIYLNRTCWNGLYRENRSGIFNVPMGTKDAVVLDEDNFARTSNLLANAELHCRDFEETVDCANEGDLLFVDPPYTVKHNLNGFVKYNDQIFSWDDQVRLSLAVLRAKGRGAIIVMTNADHQSIRNLYKDHFRLRTVKRATFLAADSRARGQTSELLITT